MTKQSKSGEQSATECRYPDWEGGLEVTPSHRYDKDGFCVICGAEVYKEIH